VSRNTPAAIIDKLDRETNAALADLKMRTRFADSTALLKFESYAASFRGEAVGRRPRVENPQSSL
jgi:hypothetical protein